MKLLFPGSFDPFTIGHADLVERALKLGAEVVIAIGINEEKKPLFSTAQRLDAIREYYNGNPAVSVIEYKGLTVDAVRDNGCDAILRGIRSVTDYDKERNLADITDAVCEEFHISPEALNSQSRQRDVVIARQVAMYLAKQYTNMSLSDIGRSIGNRTHATVMHALDVLNGTLAENIVLGQRVHHIENQLAG